MRAGRNVAAALGNSIWTALLGLAVVPIYVRYLGIETYGLIGFFATMQALFQIFDLGLAPTVNREVARCSVSGTWHEVQSLVRTLGGLYWTVAAAIAVGLALGASLIAHYWLTPKNIPHETVVRAVMLMGFVMACRWPIALYQGVMVGAQALTTSSAIAAGMATFGSLGAIAVLHFVSRTVTAFFIWQAITGLLYALIMRHWAWKTIGGGAHARFDLGGVRRIWRFSVGMTGVALSAIVFSQLDKVLLSKLLPLDRFGEYALATVAANGLYLIITPLFNVIYPRFSALVAAGNETRLVALYRVGTRLLAIGLFPLAITMAIFAEDLVRIWTGNPQLATSVAPLIALLAMGSALHGMMYFPFALQLAYGLPQLSFTINMILMVVLVPLVIVLAKVYGAVGGALAWLLLHLMYVLLGTWLTHRRLLVGTGAKWLCSDVGLPLAVSLLVIVPGYQLIQLEQFSVLARLVSGAALALVAGVVSISMSRNAYEVMIHYLPWRVHGS